MQLLIGLKFLREMIKLPVKCVETLIWNIISPFRKKKDDEEQYLFCKSCLHIFEASLR